MSHAEELKKRSRMAKSYVYVAGFFEV